MRRRTFDVLVSAGGMFLVVVLAVAGGLLTWGHNYITHEVHNQLAAQKIYFPPKNSPAIAAPEFKAMHQYAGQQLTTGAQAEVYADHFIANHLKAIGGGQTYAQLSTQAQAQPNNAKLQATVNTMFKGETLRGLLLNAYAFGTIGDIAGYAAIAAFSAAGVLLVLSGFGLYHSRRVPVSKEVFGTLVANGQPAEREPVLSSRHPATRVRVSMARSAPFSYRPLNPKEGNPWLHRISWLQPST